MNKEKEEKRHQRKQQELFNSDSRSVKPGQQNEEHNVRKEGLWPKNNKY